MPVAGNCLRLAGHGTALPQPVAHTDGALPLFSSVSSWQKLTSPTSATVIYNITGGGTTLLGGKTGKAVYQDGVWKVGDASLCGLFKLIPGGTVPAACNSVS